VRRGRLRGGGGLREKKRQKKPVSTKKASEIKENPEHAGGERGSEGEPERIVDYLKSKGGVGGKV